MTDRTETAALACEHLASGTATRGHAADALRSVPLVHPLRRALVSREDRDVVADCIAEAAEAVADGEAAPDELRVLASALRAGVPEMLATGWGWMLR